MKILFDHQAFCFQDYGGVSRYFAELMRGLARLGTAEYRLSLGHTNNRYLLSEPFCYRSFSGGYRFPGQVTLLSWLNTSTSRHALRQGDFNVFHPTYYDPYFVDELGAKPFVLTIFDMIHELFPDDYPLTDKIRAQKKFLAERANFIIAISENTKRDIVKLLGVSSEKIRVIYLGSSLVADGRLRDKDFGAPHRYILFVGKREGYKNFRTLVGAFEKLSVQMGDVHLVCAGGGQFSRSERTLFRERGLLDRVMYFDGSHEVMTHLYMNAAAFVFPSLYEGFGIPVLEAFACQCPVILSATSSLPEVAGEAAIYFDPLSEHALLEALKTVLSSQSKRQDMIDKGSKQLKKFSWDKAVKEAVDVYQSVV
jgi:glycosyltransferase involved in cell wall biosynthesis